MNLNAPGDETSARCAQTQFDVIVVGAGMGGIYALHRFSRQGLSVLGLESAGGVGGVWHHNRYPGARVDVESLSYCYHFSEELFREWKWSERYASQPELERYLNYAADKFDLKKYILFNHTVTAVRRLAEANLWEVGTDTGEHFTCRFLVTAMGNLTAPSSPDFPGLADFKGEWMQAARWPDCHVDLTGKIGVVGTGATGVQIIPAVAANCEHLTVFQRSPGFVGAPWNRPLDPGEIDAIADRFDRYRAELFASPTGSRGPTSNGPVTRFTEPERQDLLEQRYRYGGQTITRVFDDQQTDWEVNQIVSEFMRQKIQGAVDDPATAAKLSPYIHGVGDRRLGMADGYYETYNRANVTLVDLREEALERITETGMQTRSGHHDLDLIIFAIGFRSFTGTLIDADIRSERGQGITEDWKPGWKTLLGLMTTGFPNLFMACGTGGIGIAANVFAANEQQMDWIGDCIAYMDDKGYKTIEPDPGAQQEWVNLVAETASRRLMMTRGVSDRSVHVDPETGERVCMNFLGGFPAFIEHCDRSAASGYAGFVLR